MTAHDGDSLRPDSDRHTGWWTGSGLEPQEPESPPEYGFEPPDETGGPLSESACLQAADLQLLHALLLQLNDQETARRESRIDRVMQAVRAGSQGPREISAVASPERQVRPHRRVLPWALAASLLIAVAGWFFISPTNPAIAALDRVVHALDDPADRTYEISVEPLQRPAPRAPDRESSPTESDGMLPEDRRPGLDGAVLFIRCQGEFVLYRSTSNGKLVINGSNGHENWLIRPDRPVMVSANSRDFRLPMPDNVATLPFVDIRRSLMSLRDGYHMEELPADILDGGAVRWRHLRATKLDPATKGPKAVSVWFHPTTYYPARIRLEQVHLQGKPEPRVMTISLVSREPLPENWFDHDVHHASDATIERD